MIKIKQGTIFGFDIYIEVPDDYKGTSIDKYTLEKYIGQEVKRRLEEIETESFLKELYTKITK